MGLCLWRASLWGNQTTAASRLELSPLSAMRDTPLVFRRGSALVVVAGLLFSSCGGTATSERVTTVKWAGIGALKWSITFDNARNPGTSSQCLSIKVVSMTSNASTSRCGFIPLRGGGAWFAAPLTGAQSLFIGPTPLNVHEIRVSELRPRSQRACPPPGWSIGLRTYRMPKGTVEGNYFQIPVLNHGLRCGLLVTWLGPGGRTLRPSTL